MLTATMHTHSKCACAPSVTKLISSLSQAYLALFALCLHSRPHNIIHSLSNLPANNVAHSTPPTPLTMASSCSIFIASSHFLPQHGSPCSLRFARAPLAHTLRSCTPALRPLQLLRTPTKKDGAVEPKKHERDGLRARTWLFLEEPSSSRGAFIVSLFIMFLIGISVLVFVLETLPEMAVEPAKSTYIPIFYGIEVFCVGAFTLEYAARLCCVPGGVADLVWHVLSAMQIIDILAILPFFVELGMADLIVDPNDAGDASGGEGALGFLRVMRLARVARVAKVSRYLVWFQMMGSAFRSSLAPLGMALAFAFVFVVLFSSLIFFAEDATFLVGQQTYINKGDGATASFQSIPDVFYYVVITMTTVGYGDQACITVVGQMISMMTAYSGIMLLAIPISIISANFANEYEAMHLAKQQKGTARLTNKLRRALGINSKVGDGKKSTRDIFEGKASDAGEAGSAGGAGNTGGAGDEVEGGGAGGGQGEGALQAMFARRMDANQHAHLTLEQETSVRDLSIKKQTRAPMQKHVQSAPCVLAEKSAERTSADAAQEAQLLANDLLSDFSDAHGPGGELEDAAVVALAPAENKQQNTEGNTEQNSRMGRKRSSLSMANAVSVGLKVVTAARRMSAGVLEKRAQLKTLQQKSRKAVVDEKQRVLDNERKNEQNKMMVMANLRETMDQTILRHRKRLEGKVKNTERKCVNMVE